jgi:transketolase
MVDIAMTSEGTPLSVFQKFKLSSLNHEHELLLNEIACNARGDILRMCHRAGSGHPGGSMSCVDIFLMLWLCANLELKNPKCQSKDHIVISHGHTAAGVYAILGQMGVVSRQAIINGFRKIDSYFEGHVNHKLDGVDWYSGNLGQGLSVGCGMAIANKIIGDNESRVFVAMGDGEQQKGQISEARHIAAKYCLNRLIAVVDCNGLQATGKVSEIMPQRLAAEYSACGWKVVETDGHNFTLLYDSLRNAYFSDTDRPTVILARTIMGKGVSFMENNYQYHGSVLNEDQLNRALAELGVSADNHAVDNDTVLNSDHDLMSATYVESSVVSGNPFVYKEGSMIDCRSAFGKTLLNLAEQNVPKIPMAVLDCDLSPSVKTAEFCRKYPDNFIQLGISEHTAVSMAGGMSKCGVLPFFANFAVFGFYECLNQHRQNDINETSVKSIFTHCGLDVGEDGKTHQCLDYIGISATLYNTRLLIPADANQTDRMVRFAAMTPSNIILAMGRSSIPVLCNEQGEAFFDFSYTFEYGKADWLRRGSEATIVTCGTFTWRAIEATRQLAIKGIKVGVLNLCCPLKPDVESLAEAAETGLVITYEDHNRRNGIGSIVASVLAERDMSYRLICLGIDGYGGSGRPEDLFDKYGLSISALVETIEKQLVH